MTKARLYVYAFIVQVVVVLTIVGCSNSSEAEAPKKPKTQVEVVTDWSNKNGYDGVREVKVNGRPCVETQGGGSQGQYGGVSCDWTQR